MSETTETAVAEARTDAPKNRSVLRTIFALVFGVIAIVSLFVSTLAVWGQSTLYSSDRVADAAAEALAAPGATEAIAVYLTDQIIEAVELENRLDNILPGPLDRLTPMIAGGAQTFVQTRLNTVLQKPDVQNLLVEVVRRAHERFMDILESDGVSGGFSIKSDTVSFNLLPLVTLGLEKIQEVGILEDLDVPQFAPDGDPTEQIAELEARLERDLPDDFAQLVVFKGDAVSSASRTLQSAQDVMVLAKRGTAAVVILTIVTLGLSLILAHRRRRVAVTLALAAAAVMLIARQVLDRVVAETPNLVANPGARSALGTAIENLTGSLVDVITLLLVIGLIAAAIVYLTGEGRIPARLRSLPREAKGGAGLVAAVLVIAIFGFTVVPIIVAILLASYGASRFATKTPV
jgi:hypothetical protein